MKVLVTGHRGFIGQHVYRAVLEAGHTVVGVDLPDVDITQGLAPIPGLDAVIHLAARSHPRQCDEDPRRAYDVNVQGTSRVLQMALKSGAKKVVFASSAHVYDIPPKVLPTDEQQPTRLNNTYTTTKLLGERLCQLYFENHGLSYAVLRLFNVYGPGQALGYFIPDMIAKAKGGTITLTGGATTKDWVYVEDVARAFVLAVESNFVGPINIGTGVETDLATIGRLIAAETGALFSMAPVGTATRMCADNTRAKRVLGWEPTVSLRGGIDLTLKQVGYEDRIHATR